MIIELDIDVLIEDNKTTPEDIEKRGEIYRSILQYVLHFLSNCKAMLAWSFTDRHSWILTYRNYTMG